MIETHSIQLWGSNKRENEIVWEKRLKWDT